MHRALIESGVQVEIKNQEEGESILITEKVPQAELSGSTGITHKQNKHDAAKVCQELIEFGYDVDLEVEENTGAELVLEKSVDVDNGEQKSKRIRWEGLDVNFCFVFLQFV